MTNGGVHGAAARELDATPTGAIRGVADAVASGATTRTRAGATG
jgi:hypothetical protein